MVLGHTLPSGKEPSAVVLDGEPVSYDVRQTNRGSEILVDAGPVTGQHSLIITTGDTQIPATGGLQPISIARGRNAPRRPHDSRLCQASEASNIRQSPENL